MAAVIRHVGGASRNLHDSVALHAEFLAGGVNLNLVPQLRYLMVLTSVWISVCVSVCISFSMMFQVLMGQK